MRQSVYLLIKGLIMLIFGFIIFSYAMFQGGFVSWFLFYSLLPVLIYYLIFILYPVNGWQVKRAVSNNSVKAGQSTTIQIELKRKFVLPFTYLVVEDFIPSSIQPYFIESRWGELLSSKAFRREPIIKRMLFQLFSREMGYEYSLSELPRGVHSFSQVRLTLTDVFGFMTKTVVIPVDSQIFVAPTDIDIQLNWDINEKQSGDEVATTLHSDRSNSISGARQYIPGDRLSAIHWKATARTNELMTKEFDQEYSRDGVIMLLGLDKGIAYEWNLAVCLALLKYLKQKNQLVDFHHVGRKLFFSSIEKEHNSLFNAFTAFEAGANDQQIKTAFDQYSHSYDKGKFLFIFTDRLTREMVEQLISSVLRKVKITLYLTTAVRDHSKLEQELMTTLKDYQINVNLVTEKQLSQRRAVVTI